MSGRRTEDEFTEQRWSSYEDAQTGIDDNLKSVELELAAEDLREIDDGEDQRAGRKAR